MNQMILLMYEEFTASIIGLFLLIHSMRVMSETLFNKEKFNISSWYLVGVYIGVINITFWRAFGIYTVNHNMRYYGALIAGLFTMVFYAFWGARQLGWTVRTQRLIIVSTVIGGLFFALGGSLNIINLESIGLIILATIIISIIVKLLRYALMNIPYLVAHQKVKLITFGVITLSIFELIGVMFMQYEFWTVATVFFVLRIIGWSIINLGIAFPRFIQEFMRFKFSKYKHAENLYYKN